MEDKIAKQQGILKTYQDEILKEQKRQLEDIDRRLGVLDGEILEKTQQATEVGAQLAEQNRLQENLRASAATLTEGWDLMH